MQIMVVARRPKWGRQKQRVERTTSHHNVKHIIETSLAKNAHSAKPFHITLPLQKVNKHVCQNARDIFLRGRRQISFENCTYTTSLIPNSICTNMQTPPYPQRTMSKRRKAFKISFCAADIIPIFFYFL